MVEKRSITLILLATLVWTSIASGSAAYYYLEQIRFADQLKEKQQLLNELKENYDASATRRNMLSGEYGLLFGEYQWFDGDNYSPLMNKYEKLVSNLHGNYTHKLEEFPELNKTYTNLLSKFQTLNEKDFITNEEFKSLLDDFYRLFTALTMKELEDIAGKTNTIHVNLCIDYRNQTIEWYNNTPVSPGATLFDLTQKVVKVEYSYWSTLEPGHILLSSINGYAEGFWLWYYWDEAESDWIFGPVGCDAWTLKDNGIYNWTCVK